MVSLFSGFLGYIEQNCRRKKGITIEEDRDQARPPQRQYILAGKGEVGEVHGHDRDDGEAALSSLLLTVPRPIIWRIDKPILNLVTMPARISLRELRKRPKTPNPNSRSIYWYKMWFSPLSAGRSAAKHPNMLNLKFVPCTNNITLGSSHTSVLV